MVLQLPRTTRVQSGPGSWLLGTTAHVEDLSEPAWLQGIYNLDHNSGPHLNVFYLSARFGLESIPEDWVMKVKQAEEILRYIETIVQC